MLAKFNAIKRLLEKGACKAPYNKTWQKISEEYEVGRVVGREICLTHDERQYLRKVFREETGSDPQGESIKGDRVSVAEKTTNEKVSKEGVFEGLVQLARFDNKDIWLKGTDKPVFTPHGSVISVPPDSIIASGSDSLVVFENGQAMVHWSEYQLPEEVREALIAYRGHGSNARWVSSSIDNSLWSKTYAFYDCDPAGLHMALTKGFDGIIVPEGLNDLVMAHGALLAVNKTSSYFDQHRSVKALERLLERGELNGCVGKLVDLMLKHKIAITQESILAHKLPLRYLPLYRGDPVNSSV